jgi:hypothetical protein
MNFARSTSIGNADYHEVPIQSKMATFILAVVFAGSLSAAPIEDGAAAYQRGDYATAMRL